MACILAARDAIKKLCARAAQIWGIPEDAVTWEKGYAKPAGANAGNFPPLSLEGNRCGLAGRPVVRSPAITSTAADGAGVSFATHICDIEVDPETGFTEDRALHRASRMPARRCIPPMSKASSRAVPCRASAGRSNEEYIYGKDGRLQNAGFLDYRIPVCSDLPMIDTHDPRDPQPGPSLWRARRRRDLDRPAARLPSPTPWRPRPVCGFTQLPISPPPLAASKAVEDAEGGGVKQAA